MYVPGHDKKKLNKIKSLKADCIVLDLEDGVGYDKKDEARSTILENYSQLKSDYAGEVGIRINPPTTKLFKQDVRMLFELDHLPSCLVVPKIDSYQDMNMLCDEMKLRYEKKLKENQQNRCKKPINLITMCESAKGLLNLKEVIECGIVNCAATSRKSFMKLSGVIFGSDDYCADLQIGRTFDATELLYARQKIVTTTSAYNMQAIDMVYIDFKDNEGLKQQSLQGKSFGFSGKQIIHPNQIETVQRAFMPSSEQVEWANQLLAAYKLSDNKGVFTFRGQMIDMPTILQAKNIKKIIET